MIEIYHAPSFVRQFKKLSEALQEEIIDKIELFKEDPSHTFLKTHKLKGKLAGFLSFSVNYQYRIVFRHDSSNAVTLLSVGDHDIYR